MQGGGGDLDRLDALGRGAASDARRFNAAQNADHQSHTASHAARVPNRHIMPITSRLGISAAIAISLCIVFSMLAIPYPVAFALVGASVIEGIWWLHKKRRAEQLHAQAIGLQAQLDDLKQQDFDMRYEEAKRSGALDRFGQAEIT